MPHTLWTLILQTLRRGENVVLCWLTLVTDTVRASIARLAMKSRTCAEPLASVIQLLLQHVDFWSSVIT